MSHPSEKTVFDAINIYSSTEFTANSVGTDEERAEDAAAFAMLDGISDGYERGSMCISDVGKIVTKLAEQK